MEIFNIIIFINLGEGVNMGDINYISYDEKDKEIVRKGIFAIQEVLMGTDSDRKRSLLLCLDWFMDPYYGQDISNIHDDLIKLLQMVIISSNEDDVAEDALNLLISYEWSPFEILAKNIEKVSENLKPYVVEAIRMDKE